MPRAPGPTTMAMRQSGLGTSWLFPFVDGAPPIGWEAASAYLSLPVALVLVQWASSLVTSPPIDPKDDNASTQYALLVRGGGGGAGAAVGAEGSGSGASRHGVHGWV